MFWAQVELVTDEGGYESQGSNPIFGLEIFDKNSFDFNSSVMDSLKIKLTELFYNGSMKHYDWKPLG